MTAPLPVPGACCTPAFNRAATTFRIVPCTGGQAAAFVAQHHRHLPWVSDRLRFACAVALDNPHEFRGVGIVANGPPEWEGTGRACITRTAVYGVPNGCSMLLGALSRAARELGYVEVWTYSLPGEPGTSLRGAGFQEMGWTDHGDNADWSSAGRPRNAPVCLRGADPHAKELAEWVALRPDLAALLVVRLRVLQEVLTESGHIAAPSGAQEQA